MTTLTPNPSVVCEAAHISCVSYGTQFASWNRVDIAFNGILSFAQPGALLARRVVQAGSLLLEVVPSHLLARDIGRLH